MRFRAIPSTCRHILYVLEEAGGDKDEAARLMGIGLSSLYRKIQELGIRKALNGALSVR